MNRRNFMKTISVGLFVGPIFPVTTKSNQKIWNRRKNNNIKEYKTSLQLLTQNKITLEEFTQEIITTAKFLGEDDGFYWGYNACLLDIKRRKELTLYKSNK